MCLLANKLSLFLAKEDQVPTHQKETTDIITKKTPMKKEEAVAVVVPVFNALNLKCIVNLLIKSFCFNQKSRKQQGNGKREPNNLTSASSSDAEASLVVTISLPQLQLVGKLPFATHRSWKRRVAYGQLGQLAH